MAIETINVLIYGGGAVGSIFGWILSRRGQFRVSVVCRSNYEQVINHGYAFHTHFWGEGTFIPHAVFPAGWPPPAQSTIKYSYIILANKIKTTDDIDRMVEDLQRFIQDGTTLVSAQNGMDNELPLRKAYPHNIILSSICNLVCSQPSPGIIVQTATIKPHAFHIGIYHTSRGEEPSPAEISSRDILVAADAQILPITNVHEERWAKLVFNSSWNSMTAISGLDTHQLFASPSLVDVVRQLAREAREIGVASGVPLAGGLGESVIEAARTSRPIVTSSLHDVRRGRKTEVASIIGYLVAQAAKVGVHVPYTVFTYEQLKLMNQTLLP